MRALTVGGIRGGYVEKSGIRRQRSSYCNPVIRDNGQDKPSVSEIAKTENSTILKSLSATGTVAAVVVGIASLSAGLSWGIILIVFFLAATAVSRIGAHAKRIATGDVVDKGGARDAWQVFANGGPFAAAAVASVLWPSYAWQIIGIGAIAASSADTWSTEIGTLSRHAPRSFIGLRTVPPGTSGGVTWLGMCAAVCGAAIVALAALLLGWHRSAVCAALVGGVGGALVDSILGGTLQVRLRCPKCDKSTERIIHVCGTTTQIVGGLHWMNNDVVNFVSSIAGALIGGACLL